MSEERRKDVGARRWCGPDGLIHETIPVVTGLMLNSYGKRTYERWRVCDPWGIRIASEKGSCLEDVDVPDDPRPVNCFGCLGGP